MRQKRFPLWRYFFRATERVPLVQRYFFRASGSGSASLVRRYFFRASGSAYLGRRYFLRAPGSGSASLGRQSVFFARWEAEARQRSPGVLQAALLTERRRPRAWKAEAAAAQDGSSARAGEWGTEAPAAMATAAATIVHDPSEAVPLCPALGLYLKPITKMTISVALPPLRTPGKSISNWEVMERLKAMVAGAGDGVQAQSADGAESAAPAPPAAHAQFSALRIAKSTLDFIRFEGEVENRALVRRFLARLDGKTIKLSGFPDALRVRAAEFRPDFPTRHDWDSFFRDAQDMNETLPGERPDTIHLEGLPCRWFAPRGDTTASSASSGGTSIPGASASSAAPANTTASSGAERPSEALLRQAFRVFGDIRRVDIPMLDPYREEMAGRSFHTFGFGGHLHFEAYVQYREYAGFVRAMAALRGMKLMFRGDDSKAVACSIKVSFDATKHLSDASIRRRQLERQKLRELELQREEQKRQEREAEERRRAEERKQKQLEQQERERRREEKLRRREQRTRDREQRRSQRRAEKLQAEEQRRLQERIRTEERKLLLAQRNLQSIRLVAELLSRAEAAKLQQHERSEERRRRQRQEERRRLQEAELRRVEEEKARALGLQRRERELRQRLLSLLLSRRPTDPATCEDPANPGIPARADDLLRPVLDILHRVTHARAPPRDPEPKAPPTEPAAPAQVLACIRENAPPKPGGSPAREPPQPPHDRDDHDKCNREPEPTGDTDSGQEGRSCSYGVGERPRQHQKRARVDCHVDTDGEEEPTRDPEHEQQRLREKDKERGRERKQSRHGRHSRSRSRSPRRRSTWNR
ncbi:A-kinase anchor protein 17A [Arvicola amphibius]|uniref:A-kinase anchor protein 17A n=1 Tax=Arvicola amphibius TaxID=1047088 RepID=UPI0018E2FFE9|nr:A-kinase anchor protein 17A [Arvicola amphibius]